MNAKLPNTTMVLGSFNWVEDETEPTTMGAAGMDTSTTVREWSERLSTNAWLPFTARWPACASTCTDTAAVHQHEWSKGHTYTRSRRAHPGNKVGRRDETNNGGR